MYGSNASDQSEFNIVSDEIDADALVECSYSSCILVVCGTATPEMARTAALAHECCELAVRRMAAQYKPVADKPLARSVSGDGQRAAKLYDDGGTSGESCGVTSHERPNVNDVTITIGNRKMARPSHAAEERFWTRSTKGGMPLTPTLGSAT